MYFIDPAGNYPRHPGDLLLEHPDWTEGQPLPEGWIEVAPGEFPAFVEGKTVEELAPVQLEDGTWVRAFKQRKMTAAEIARKAEMDALNG